MGSSHPEAIIYCGVCPGTGRRRGVLLGASSGRSGPKLWVGWCSPGRQPDQDPGTLEVGEGQTWSHGVGVGWVVDR